VIELEADIRIPIFVSGHPSRLISHLVDNNYNPVFYFDTSISKTKKSWEVFILLSIVGLFQFAKEKINRRITKSRIVVFPSKVELDFFSEYSLMFKIYRRKDIKSFIPSFVNLNIARELESHIVEKPRGKEMEIVEELLKDFKRLKKGTK
jgi:hypothetical protein